MRDDVESCPVCASMVLKNRCTDYGCFYGKLISNEEDKNESLSHS
jgi:hypothetical protein